MQVPGRSMFRCEGMKASGSCREWALQGQGGLWNTAGWCPSCWNFNNDNINPSSTQLSLKAQQRHMDPFPSMQTSLQIPIPGHSNFGFEDVNPQQKERALSALCQSTPHSPTSIQITTGSGVDSESGSTYTSPLASQNQNRRQTGRSHRELANSILAQWHQQVLVSLAGNQDALQGHRWPRPCRTDDTARAFPTSKPIRQIFVLSLQQTGSCSLSFRDSYTMLPFYT